MLPADAKVIGGISLHELVRRLAERMDAEVDLLDLKDFQIIGTRTEGPFSLTYYRAWDEAGRTFLIYYRRWSETEPGEKMGHVFAKPILTARYGFNIKGLTTDQRIALENETIRYEDLNLTSL